MTARHRASVRLEQCNHLKCERADLSREKGKRIRSRQADDTTFFQSRSCDHAALSHPSLPSYIHILRHIGCTTREPSKTLATVPETRRSEQEIKCRKRADWSRTRLSAKVTTTPKLIEIVRNPHAEGQFNHVKGLKRD